MHTQAITSTNHVLINPEIVHTAFDIHATITCKRCQAAINKLVTQGLQP